MIWYRIKSFLLERKKAVAAAVAPLLVGFVAKYGFNVDVPVVEALIFAAVSAIATERTTNLSK